MGTPTKQTWPDGLKLAANMNFRFPQCSQVPLAKLMQSASPDAVELMTGLCAWCAPARLPGPPPRACPIMCLLDDD